MVFCMFTSRIQCPCVSVLLWALMWVCDCTSDVFVSVCVSLSFATGSISDSLFQSHSQLNHWYVYLNSCSSPFPSFLIPLTFLPLSSLSSSTYVIIVFFSLILQFLNSPLPLLLPLLTLPSSSLLLSLLPLPLFHLQGVQLSCLHWNPHEYPEQLAVSTSDGTLHLLAVINDVNVQQQKLNLHANAGT